MSSLCSLVYNNLREFANRIYIHIVNIETRMDLQVRLMTSNIIKDVEFVCKQDIASLIRSYRKVDIRNTRYI